MTKTHYIKKQNIELAFSSENAANEHWDSLTDFHKEEGHAIMSELFDRLVPEQRWIRIDSLKIDLGKLSLRNFRQDYLEQLRSSLERSLIDVIQEKSLALADPIAVWEATIIHYLKHGTFLWETATESSSLMSDQSSPVRDQLEENIVERLQSSPNFARAIGIILLESENAMNRWTRQFPVSFHKRVKSIVLQYTNSSYKPLLLRCIDLIEETLAHKRMTAGAAFESAQQQKWKMLFSGSVDLVNGCIEEWISEAIKIKVLRVPLLDILIHAPIGDKSEILDMLRELPELFYQQQEAGMNIPARLEQKMADVLSNLRKKENETNNTSNALVNRESDKDNTDQPIAIEESNAETAGLKQKRADDLDNGKKWKAVESKSAEMIPDEQEIYISNAGIVLLAPFIEPFFNQFGLGVENKLEDDTDASLGIQLLNQLTGGSWDEEEHRLVLNKILCGRLPQWAGYRISDVPSNAKQESVELLQTVIDYWPALKNTSPEAVQQTFLQRQGKLIFKDEQWQLWVEYKTQDILLESIPWTYSVIKLPWMEYPLYVNW